MRRLPLVFVFFFSASALAGPTSWTTTGPSAASIWDIEYDPVTSSKVFATTDGALFRSTDGGNTWSVVSSAPTGTAITSVEIDPSNVSILYVTTERKGIWKSVNGGTTWSSASSGLPWPSAFPSEYEPVWTIAVTPTNGSILYAGTSRGVYKSTDSGSSWAPTGRIGTAPVVTIVVDPNSATTVYAGLRGEREGGSTDGVYKSTNSGTSWTAANTNLWRWSTGVFVIWDLEIDGSTTPSTLYVAYDAGGLSKSTDGAATWVDANLSATGSALFEEAFSVDVARSSPTTLFVGGLTNVFKSTDRGGSFVAVSTGITGSYFGALAVDPLTAANVVTGNADVFRTTNGGAAWSKPTGITGGPIESLAYNASGGAITAIGRDNVFRSTDNAASWTRVSNFGGRSAPELISEGGALYAITAETGCRGFVGYGAKLAKSTDNGATWTFTSLGTAARGRSLAVHPANTNIIYASMTLSYDNTEPPIMKSTDGGATWTNLFPPFQAPKLVVHPTNTSIVFAGAGAVWRSTNGGSTWTKSNSGLPNNFWYSVTSLAIDPSNANHMLAGSDVFLFESFDGGIQWSPVEVVDLETLNSYDELYVTGIVFDPVTSGTIYLSTRRYGVFRSTDSGVSWSTYNTGLLDTRINDMILGPGNSLHVATQGTGVFSIGGPSPLPAPVLTAQASNATSVSITWTYSGAPTQFELERKSPGGTYGPVTTTSALTYTDSSVAANTTYLYRVRPVGGTTFSNVDHATTVAFTDNPLVVGTTRVKATHFVELRTAVNAVRAAAGLAAATWTDAALVGVAIKSVHMNELRNALTPALTILGKTLTTSETVNAGTRIRANHVTEIRTAVR